MAQEIATFDNLDLPGTWGELKELVRVHEIRVHQLQGRAPSGEAYPTIDNYLATATSRSLLRAFVAAESGAVPVIYGGLQRPAYMYDLFANVYRRQPESFKEAMRIRLGRAALWQAAGVKAEIIITRQALKFAPWVGKAALIDQLQYLETIASDPSSNIKLSILPVLSADIQPLPDLTFFYPNFPEDQTDRCCFSLPNPHLSEITIHPADIPVFEDLWSKIQKAAPVENALPTIQDAIKEAA